MARPERHGLVSSSANLQVDRGSAVNSPLGQVVERPVDAVEAIARQGGRDAEKGRVISRPSTPPCGGRARAPDPLG